MGDVFNALNRTPPLNPPTPPNLPPNPALPPNSRTPENSAETGGLGQAFPSGASLAEETAGGLPIEQISQAAPAYPVESAEKTSPVSATATTPLASAMAQSQQQTAATHLLPDRQVPDDFYAPDVVVHHDRGSIITEQYRAIRTQIIARAKQRRMQTHVITSSAPDEGKTVTCINLGLAFAEMRNQRTLLLECDLRRPSFDQYFHRSCRPGLLQFLRGELSEIDPAIYPTGYDNLHFIPAGARETTQSTELLSSPKMTRLLDRLRDRYDTIFIDTPPVVTVTDACILGAAADQTMLVVRLNKTPADMIERAKRLLRAANCELAGVVLTHLQQTVGKYRYGYQSYNYNK